MVSVVFGWYNVVVLFKDYMEVNIGEQNLSD